MGRQLRPRRTRTNYATLTRYGSEDENDEEVSGPSSSVVAPIENDSESDFSPDKGVAAAESNEDTEEDEADGQQLDEMGEDELDEDKPKPKSKPTKLKARKPSAKAKGKAKEKPKPKTESVAPVGPPTAKRQTYTLPTPSVHHRHRAVPLHSRAGRVERLISCPRIFQSPSTALTNGLTENTKISDRVNKSWGYNVGPGPLWDLVEDRAWFKEAIITGSNVDSEASRRPRVYSGIKLSGDLEILSIENAAPYLPTDDVTTEEGNLQPPPVLTCQFGPLENMERRGMKMFDSFAMSKYFSESKAHVFNTGAPVWGLDWCPVHPQDHSARAYTQYLAVAPFPSHSHSPDIGRKVIRPSYSCIQIWSLSASSPNTDVGEIKCEMVLCLDTGPAYDLKWCPLPSHDLKAEGSNSKKLGLLGGTFEDGSFSLFVVPDPSDVRPEGSNTHPVCVRVPHPLIRIEHEEACCWTFDWANSEVVAIGMTNGSIVVYNLGSVLNTLKETNQPPIVDLLPTHHLSVHQSAVRALVWIKAPPCSTSGEPAIDQDPTVIASAGYDGMECLTDIRDGRGSVMNRTRDVINAIAYSPFAGGPITMDHENTVKAYSASPSMLGRGHALFEPQGPVWSVSASDFHPQLAAGASDGTCSTTNMLRSTRRGGSVPFFVHKIFQMDYNRNTKEYRMLDHFLPQESVDRTTATRTLKAKAKAEDPPLPPSTGSWPREVGVHRVVWNNGNGLASSSMLASGTSSGLCRVDVLWGRWMRDKIPYTSVEGIRMENEDADADPMEVDSEVSDDEEDSDS